MASTSIPEVPENQLPARIPAVSTPETEELEPQALLMLLEFFLLLDQWDRQGSC
jgi:hypothetical protein